jgi:hypothetical protein
MTETEPRRPPSLGLRPRPHYGGPYGVEEPS